MLSPSMESAKWRLLFSRFLGVDKIVKPPLERGVQEGLLNLGYSL